MNLIQAVKSGKPFRRTHRECNFDHEKLWIKIYDNQKGERTLCYLAGYPEGGDNCRPAMINWESDILADDYEIKD